MEFKSLIISIFGFRNFFCCLVWAIDLGVQINDEGRSFYIGSFCPAMTSLSRYFEEAAFSTSISSSVFIFLWLFSWFLILFSFHVRTCSENLDLPSEYLKSEIINHLLCE